MAKKSQDIRFDILKWLETHPVSSSMDIHNNAGISISYASTKRHITELIREGLLLVSGQGKGTR